MIDQQRERPIEVGLYLETGGVPHAGVITNWSDVLAVARRAEEVGFDSIWVGDHLLIDFGADRYRDGGWECLSLLSALAATTNRVRIGPLVAATAYRNPALLAKMASTIDEISSGRLVLGLGAGWHEPEFRSFGFPYDHRVDRFEEAIEIITRLVRGERVTFHGTYYQPEDCELLPRGGRPGGPPIMIGAKGPRMIALAARYADIWDSDLAPVSSDPTCLRPALATLDAACRDAGRDPATIMRSTWILVDVPGHSQPEDHPIVAMRASWGVTSGSPEQLAELLRGYAAEGFNALNVWLDPCTPEGVEELAKALAILDRG